MDWVANFQVAIPVSDEDNPAADWPPLSEDARYIRKHICNGNQQWREQSATI